MATIRAVDQPTSPDVLPDVLGPNLRIVFCGSAAGRASALVGAYYAGSGNRFWPTLRAVGLTDRELAPEEFRAVLGYGIGLTDLVKRASGADHELPEAADDVAGLVTRIERCRPRFLAFNGKRAARAVLGGAVAYGPQTYKIGRSRVAVLPSTSGAARRYWDIAPWRALAAAAR